VWVVINSIDGNLAKTTHVLLVNKTPGPGCVTDVRMVQLTKALAHITALSGCATLLPKAFPPSGSDVRNRKTACPPVLPRRLT